MISFIFGMSVGSLVTIFIMALAIVSSDKK